ncbi:MAG TPA: N-acetyltransferase [Bryobacteraceae bacterium]|nr:N-acetyltransferase [Bryobacteraceae bacterium]
MRRMRNVLTMDSPVETAMREVHHSPAVTVRKASMLDIHPLLDLINGYAAQGVMLPRTEFEMSENIRDFTLAWSGDELVGCGALHFYTPTSGEVRSLAVNPHVKSRGVGRKILEALEREARDCGLHTIFAFTYVTGFFEKLGFVVVERGELPLKAWKDCLRCPKFSCCDETAVVKYLVENPVQYQEPENALPGLIHLPVLRRS